MRPAGSQAMPSPKVTRPREIVIVLATVPAAIVTRMTRAARHGGAMNSDPIVVLIAFTIQPGKENLATQVVTSPAARRRDHSVPRGLSHTSRHPAAMRKETP